MHKEQRTRLLYGLCVFLTEGPFFLRPYRGRFFIPMSDPKAERRSRKRVAAQVPATVATSDHLQRQAAITRDLSMTGVFLYADEHLAQGAKIEVVLMLPAELGLGEKQWACCEASVVRVEDAKGRVGVAARIDRMDVLPEILS